MKATVLRDWLDRHIKDGGDFEVCLPDGKPIKIIEMENPPVSRTVGHKAADRPEWKAEYPTPVDIDMGPPFKRKAPQGKSRKPKSNHPWKMMPVGRQMPFMDKIDERRAEENYLMGPEESR